ncbi:MAG TPA: MMPL family transporter, partial [Planctomycetota bacterium]|nr:MMPL family transporter [Planctomycetota bacterium]
MSDENQAASHGVTGETGTSLAERFTARLAHTIVEHPRSVIAIAFLITGLASALAWSRLVLDTDRNNLIGTDQPYNQRYMALEKEFGDTAAMVVVGEGPDRPRCRAFAAEVAARCQKEPKYFGNVFFRVPIEELRGRALLLAARGDLKELASTLEDTDLFLRVFKGEGLGGILQGLADHVNKRVDRPDPGDEGGGENMGDILLTSLDAVRDALVKAKPYDTPWKDVVDDGYPWMKPAKEVGSTSRYGDKGQRLAVLVMPTTDPEDGSHPSAERLRGIVDALKADPAWKDMKIGLTGGPVLEVDEMETYRRDATIATCVGFFAVILLFMISFRRVLGPVCAGICLAMAIALTLAFATIWPGHLNLISIVFMEILIGLGIDFGIHLISRYDEERTYGMAPAPALEAALGLTGRASAAGAMTTALAFSATYFADFQGIREFGIIAAVGILCCLSTMLLVLPAMVVLADRGAGGLSRRPRPGWARTRAAVKLDHWAIRRPRRLVLVSLGLAAGMLVLGLRWVRYSGNLLELQATNLESVQYANDLVQGDTIANLVAETPRELEEYARAMEQLKDVVDHTESAPVFQDEKLGYIARIGSVVAAVPDNPPTPPVVAPRDALASLVAGVDAFSQSLARAQELAAFAHRREEVEGIETIQKRLEAITEAANPEGPEAEARGKALLSFETGFRGELQALMGRLRDECRDTKKIEPNELPPVLRDRFVGKTGKLLLLIYPKKPIFDDAPLEEFVSRIRSVTPALTGVPVQIYETGKRMKEGYEKAGLLAFVAIAIYLLIHFRSAGYALITLSALVAGSAIGVGFLALKGETLNPANMLAIPLTLGIGVCYAIQLVHRHRQASARPSVAGPQPVVATSTGRGVILSAGTNVVGFGAL